MARGIPSASLSLCGPFPPPPFALNITAHRGRTSLLLLVSRPPGPLSASPSCTRDTPSPRSSSLSFPTVPTALQGPERPSGATSRTESGPTPVDRRRRCRRARRGIVGLVKSTSLPADLCGVGRDLASAAAALMVSPRASGAGGRHAEVGVTTSCGQSDAPPQPAARPHRQNSVVATRTARTIAAWNGSKEKRGEGWRLKRAWVKRGAALTTSTANNLHHLPPCCHHLPHHLIPPPALVARTLLQRQ